MARLIKRKCARNLTAPKVVVADSIVAKAAKVVGRISVGLAKVDVADSIVAKVVVADSDVVKEAKVVVADSGVVKEAKVVDRISVDLAKVDKAVVVKVAPVLAAVKTRADPVKATVTHLPERIFNQDT